MHSAARSTSTPRRNRTIRTGRSVSTRRRVEAFEDGKVASTEISFIVTQRSRTGTPLPEIERVLVPEHECYE